MYDIIIGGDFTIPHGDMISAQGEANNNEWYVAVGKSGAIWLYHPDRSTLWVSGGEGSRGCGGSVVDFPLANGLGKISLKGPWGSNADSFFDDTGIDVRSNFITWGCVGTGRSYDANSGQTKITGVVWFDAEPVKGPFERVGIYAWYLQEKSDVPLFVYSESAGGSSHGTVTMPYKMRVARGIQKPVEW